VFSKNTIDLGKANNFEHKIELKIEDPMYVKQFPMPEVHRDLLDSQIKERVIACASRQLLKHKKNLTSFFVYFK
jgi:hypothetical protein